MSATEPQQFHTIGAQPELVGSICEAFLCESFVYRGETITNASVTFAKFAGIWHRLVIDFPAVIWRVIENEPLLFYDPPADCSYPRRNVGVLANVVGSAIKALEVTATGNKVVVNFHFSNGKLISIEGDDSASNYVIA